MLRKTAAALPMLMLATASLADPMAADWSSLRGQDAVAVNASLVGKQIVVDGYLLPVDREGDNVYEFMLVPVAGACSHLPQPPPNQIIHVFLKPPYRSAGNYEPVSVSGTLAAEDETTQFYMIDGIKAVRTAYTLKAATVTPAAGQSARPASPWPFIKQ